MGLPEVYLYEKDTRAVTYADFVNKELVLFSNCDNERSIPCVVDGFKPGQRKVMFTCLKRNDKREVKVINYFDIGKTFTENLVSKQSFFCIDIDKAETFSICLK